MKKPLLLVFLFLVLLTGVFAQNNLPDNISSQAENIFYTLSPSNESTQVITAKQVTESTIITSIAPNVNPDNVCLSLGSFKANPNWFLGEKGSYIKYVGDRDQDVEFFVLCENSSKLMVTSHFFPAEKINLDYISHCPQFRNDNDELGCAVVLTKSVSMGGDDFSVAYFVFFIFAILVILPMVFIFKAEETQMKIFNLIKFVFLLAVFVVFYLLSSILSTLVIVLLLFFFFVQINLSIAPMILGLQDDETALTKLLLKIVLLLEVAGLVVSLILLSPLL